jgi:hypothetical protein
MDSSHYNNVCGRLFSTYVDEVTEDPMVTVPQREQHPADVNDQRIRQHDSETVIGFRVRSE